MCLARKREQAGIGIQRGPLSGETTIFCLYVAGADVDPRRSAAAVAGRHEDIAISVAVAGDQVAGG